MEINILTFGLITEIISESDLKVSDVNSTDELTKKLMDLFPKLTSETYVIAVNKKVIQNNTELKNGDTVALLPPFSGG